jgi:hypothetical protein
MSEDTFDTFNAAETRQESVEVDVSSLSSVALARLVDEVRNDQPTATYSYDRTHNRHNR